MILLKNGFIIKENKLIKKDILIDDNIISKIEDSIDLDCEKIDVNGLLIMPGAVDVHVHLREPGFEKKETVKTESSNTYYRVVAGSYTNRANADKLVSDLKSKGYPAFIDIYKK